MENKIRRCPFFIFIIVKKLVCRVLDSPLSLKRSDSVQHIVHTDATRFVSCDAKSGVAYAAGPYALLYLHKEFCIFPANKSYHCTIGSFDLRFIATTTEIGIFFSLSIFVWGFKDSSLIPYKENLFNPFSFILLKLIDIFFNFIKIIYSGSTL